MPQPAPPHWQPVPFVLTYRIGEKPLFRRTFASLTLDAHFFDLGTDPLIPPPPLERFAAGVEAIVTRSHPVEGDLETVTIGPDALRYVLGRYTRFHTWLDGDFEGYLQKFSAKSRSTLKRKVKKFLGLSPDAGMREYRTPAEMETFVRLAREVSARTYQERLLDAGLPGEPAYLTRLQALAQDDDVRAWLLFADGQPVAYLCCPAANGVLLYEYLGYDPAYAGHSPGSVLQYLAFESLFAQPRFRAFDFTAGQGEHKRFFGTHSTDCADLCYFPPTPQYRLAVVLHRSLDGMSVAAARALDRVGLKARVKRLMRRAA